MRVTCRSCRCRNRCLEYSRKYPCRDYKKRTPAVTAAKGSGNEKIYHTLIIGD